MSEIFVPPNCCNIGDVLADDVTNALGVTIAAKNTIINEYLRDKFFELQIPCIWLYQPAEIIKQQARELELKSRMEVEETYKGVLLKLKDILTEIATGCLIDYEKCIEISNSLVNGIKKNSHIINCLIDIKTADEYTYSHSVNVALYSMLIAKWIDLPEHAILEVVQAGLLHDIGKVNIPDKILNKIEKLTLEEFEVIKRHPMDGYNLIKDNRYISVNVKRAVLLHHERIDGSGYPLGFYNNAIGLFAKIVSVADVYDAMTQNRVYKNKASPFDAFEMFLTSGKQIFDSNVLKVFLKNMPSYYIGVKAFLSNGDIGQIVHIPPDDIINPIVCVKSKYIDLSVQSSLRVLSLL